MSTVAREPTADLGFDVSSLEFWLEYSPAQRDAAFARLRRERPISWWGPVESISLPPEMSSGGYWALTRYEDIRRVSRDERTFCSGQGVMFFDAPPEMLEATTSFLSTDAPRHTKLRGLVSAAFTPRQVARLEERIAFHAREVVTRLLEHEEGDFVQLCAKQVPMRMIAEMIGVSGEDEERLQEAAALVREMNLGATAIGTGINAHPDYAALVCRRLSEIAASRERWQDAVSRFDRVLQLGPPHL